MKIIKKLSKISGINMKQNLIFIIFPLIIFLFSCENFFYDPTLTPTPVPEPTSTPVTHHPTPYPHIIDHMGVQSNINIPAWLINNIEELENEDKYQPLYLFIEDHPQLIDADNIELSYNYMIEWASSYELQENVHNLVVPRISYKFENLAGENNSLLEMYKEHFLQIISEAIYVEAKLVDHFWIRKRYFNIDNTINYEEFRYFFLITIPREELNLIIQDAFSSTNNFPWSTAVSTEATNVQQQWGNTL